MLEDLLTTTEFLADAAATPCRSSSLRRRNSRRSTLQPVLEEAVADNGTESNVTLQKRADDIVGDFILKMDSKAETHLGYPLDAKCDFRALHCLNNYGVNNVGDPFAECSYGLHSRPFELGVLEWFAKLWEIESNEYWGYVTTGGSEGNMHGLYVGRENHPEGILYTSAETHYSVFKAARMYRMQCEMIPTLPNGEINYELLQAALQKNRHLPAILNVNIGTTVKGAVDDLDRILDILEETGFTEQRFHIHCDGALSGLMIPFLQIGQDPMITFKKPIGSVSISGHKFLGSPFPCGIVMTRKRFVGAIMNDIEYIGSGDATISGSRSGHTAIYLWYIISTKGYAGLQKDAERCVRNAHLLKCILKRAGLPVFRNELSNTVVFERPRDADFIKRWQLAYQGDLAHVITMPNTSISKLETFVKELLDCHTANVQRDIHSILTKAKDEQP